MRAEIDTFLEALERAEWLALSGRSDAAGVEAIYDRHAGEWWTGRRRCPTTSPPSTSV